MIMEAGKLAVSKLEIQGELTFQLEFTGRKKLMSQLKSSQARGVSSYAGEDETFVLFSPSTDWVRPTHIGKGNLLYFYFFCSDLSFF